MKFLNLLAVAGCIALAVIGSTTLYSCNREAKAEQTEAKNDIGSAENVSVGKLYGLTVIQNTVDTFYFKYVPSDLYKALTTGEHLYIYDVYSPREKGNYNAWSEKACTYGSWEIIDGDTVRICNLVYRQ